MLVSCNGRDFLIEVISETDLLLIEASFMALLLRLMID